jgi:hypothetical protein
MSENTPNMNWNTNADENQKPHRTLGYWLSFALIVIIFAFIVIALLLMGLWVIKFLWEAVFGVALFPPMM